MSRAELARCAAGLDASHVQGLCEGHSLTPAAASAWNRLVKRAAGAGFDLAPASSWRDYARQLAIFNGKALGSRPVHDDEGRLLCCADFDDWPWLQRILRFSALPGASRHHWGTDLDVYDRHALPDDYQLQLTPQEYGPDGVQSGLTAWLDDLLAADDAEGFFRPYAVDRGGVAPEPWHLSYRPDAQRFAEVVSPERLLTIWRQEPAIEMADTVTARLDEIWSRYVVLAV